MTGAEQRDLQVQQLTETPIWDILIIGGGATGLGCALDAASRGFKTLLLEQADFAKGTSSRSTKLVHGGVRYLAAGDVALVYEALKERGLMLQNAPHLVKKQSFVIPCYSTFEKIKYVIGLKMYDWLAGKFSFGSSVILNKTQTSHALNGITTKNLKGGVQYFDGQFDDARLALNIAQTALNQGATVLNYLKVTALLKTNGLVGGLVAQNVETGVSYQLKAKTIVNATGVFVDDILRLDTPNANPLVRPSQGVHVVLDQKFMPANSALMIPKTSDGRVLFAVPWHNHLIVGTTDTPLNNHSLEPQAQAQEVDFILQTAGLFLATKPLKTDVLSVFAGLRPLAAPQKDTGKTKEISRSHKLIVGQSHLITITGGKWTTYRKMAQDVVDKAIKIGKLPLIKCQTENLAIHGSTTITHQNHFDVYGTDALLIQKLIAENPIWGTQIHPNFAHTIAEVVWATHHEMARTVEDVLARRLRILFLDANAAVCMAPKVAEIMAKELGFDNDWQQSQLQAFNKLAQNYILSQP